MEEAEMARAYINITNQMGPSAQLLAFINRDGGLGNELGLESFDSFSTQTQHEILLTKLDPDTLEALALENLGDRIDKMSKWLLYGGGAGLLGAIGLFTQGSEKMFLLGGLSLGAIFSGAFVRNLNKRINGVITTEDFHKFQVAFNNYLREELLAANKIPASPDSDAWKNFVTDKATTVATKTAKVVFEIYTGIKLKERTNILKTVNSKTITKRDVPYKAQWDEKTFADATKWLVDTTRKVKEMEVDHAKKLEAIDKWVTSDASAKDVQAKIKLRTISTTLEKQFKTFENNRKLINWISKELERVAKLFEAK